MRKLALLHVAISGRNGGAEGQTAALVSELCRRGHRILCLVRRGSPLERRSTQAGAPIFPLQPGFPAGPGGLLTAWSRRRARDLLSGGKWDLVHYADADSLSRVEPILASSASGAPARSRAVVTWRGPAAGKGFRTVRALRAHQSRGGAIHVASEAIRSALVREGFREGSLEVIHPGISVDDFSADPGGRESARRALQLDGEDEVVGTVAILDRDRGVGDLIDAVPALVRERPRIRIVIVGDGSRRGTLEERARTIGASERIRFTGHHEPVSGMLRAFDLYVFPGKGGEIFPISLVEAMASAVPVVVCDQPGIREIIENGKQGLFVPGTGPEALARTILRSLADGEASRAMARAGAVRVQRFTTRAMVDATERLYYRLVRSAEAA